MWIERNNEESDDDGQPLKPPFFLVKSNRRQNEDVYQNQTPELGTFGDEDKPHHKNQIKQVVKRDGSSENLFSHLESQSPPKPFHPFRQMPSPSKKKALQQDSQIEKEKASLLTRQNYIFRFFYVFLNLLYLLALALEPGPFHTSLLQKNSIFFVPPLIVVFGSILLYFQVARAPGFLPISNDHDDHTSPVASFIEKKEGWNSSVEDRFCTVCNLTQPIRTRHCTKCNRCVPEYDHHCLWIGTCIGQNNRCVFWWFLCFQTTAIIYTIILSAQSIEKGSSVDDWIIKNWLYIIQIAVLAFFGLMTSILAIFHSYLAVTNQTTWEILRREKISYLKHLPDSAVPFNRGICHNLCHYFCVLHPSSGPAPSSSSASASLLSSPKEKEMEEGRLPPFLLRYREHMPTVNEAEPQYVPEPI